MRTTSFIILFFFSFFIYNLYAVPANPYPGVFVQPNGEEIIIMTKGDERQHWAESEDGYTLLRNADNYLVYAVKNEKGDMIASNIVVQPVEKRSAEAQKLLEKTPKFLQYSPTQRTAWKQLKSSMPQTFSSENRFKVNKGKKKAICVMMEFPDKAFIHTKEEFEQLFNQEGYENGLQKGSVSDFYRQNSYGNLDLEFTVIGPVMAKNPWSYYGKNKSNGNDQNPDKLIQEARAAIMAGDDGSVDILHVIYAGFGEESSRDECPDCIWAHSVPYVYSCSPELRDYPRSNPNSEMTYIGVICHELGHVLGSPDYYDADGAGSGGEYAGTGKWDLMSNGSWNNNGATPAYINMVQKINYGWLEPMALDYTQEVRNMPNSAENPIAYLLTPPNANEYYVLENRQRIGFDAYLPGNGLLIYHVTENSKQFQPNEGHPQGVYPVCASSSYEIPTGTVVSYGSINSSGCPFPRTGTPPKDFFSATSTPAAMTWDGKRLEQSVTHITQADQLISFDFSMGTTLLQLKAAVENQTVTLNWEKPATDREIKGYNIYRDDQFMLFSTQKFFRELLETAGQYIYGVSVIYADNSESSVEKISVKVNNTGIEAIEKNFIPSEMAVYTPSGLLVFHAKIKTDGILPATNLPAGIYILKLKGENRVSTSKFVVK
ncbi:hypothetical protein AGMMS50262_20990 [Bacteroidia bacterium]|nr:hypothetical protein AGMMS50262_20990 [Bacteroidia bacterium]